jgi:hypothetical protein
MYGETFTPHVWYRKTLTPHVWYNTVEGIPKGRIGVGQVGQNNLLEKCEEVTIDTVMDVPPYRFLRNGHGVPKIKKFFVSLLLWRTSTAE